eukprot:CAMPEP_0119341796 /NCGR_PEP_ID=MMETSP1333-20130426/103286_1 /TAXON_ID=418940 /ORGANISM="Scyphosphaera apsteinii, Strain RCC1455" /LENGTH=357 /DNA_ID=CAMNT_0007353867 /DNA_START=144 /DNA_END=1217 /DNA_ORIENTATION=-
MQNAAFVLLMRMSKVMQSNYNSTVAVLVTEVLKAPLSVLLLTYELGSPLKACSTLYKDIAGNPLDTLKIAVPALLYTVQNNALFIAVDNLEAAVFQVTYQLKTLTTAVLTVVLLGRNQLVHQWFSLMLLMGGTALVQEPKTGGANSSPNSGFLIGVAATVVACICSSVASVYLEKILVESKPSIWVRNFQLCIFTIPIAFVSTTLVDDKYMKEDGNMLHGFTGVVWAAILTNAVGGMIVAAVMKFAGNILRNFAQAAAIILGGLGSWLLFDFNITMRFNVGVALVIGSIFIYGTKVEQLGQWKNSALSLFKRSQKDPTYTPLPMEEAAAAAVAEDDEETSLPPSPLVAASAGSSKAR